MNRRYVSEQQLPCHFSYHGMNNMPLWLKLIWNIVTIIIIFRSSPDLSIWLLHLAIQGCRQLMNDVICHEITEIPETVTRGVQQNFNIRLQKYFGDIIFKTKICQLLRCLFLFTFQSREIILPNLVYAYFKKPFHRCYLNKYLFYILGDYPQELICKNKLRIFDCKVPSKTLVSAKSLKLSHDGPVYYLDNFWVTAGTWSNPRPAFHL